MGDVANRWIPCWRLLRLWASVADDVLHDAMQSEEGVAYTAAYIRGATRSRQQRNRMIEILSELCNVPTRAEVDDLHREVHALKKQLRRSARGVKPAPAAPRKKHRTSTPQRRGSLSEHTKSQRAAGVRASALKLNADDVMRELTAR